MQLPLAVIATGWHQLCTLWSIAGKQTRKVAHKTKAMFLKLRRIWYLCKISKNGDPLVRNKMTMQQIRYFMTPKDVFHDDQCTVGLKTQKVKKVLIGCDMPNRPVQWVPIENAIVEIFRQASFEIRPLFSLFLIWTPLSSGQKWFLRPYFPLIRGSFLLRSCLGFCFGHWKCPNWEVAN